MIFFVIYIRSAWVLRVKLKPIALLFEFLIKYLFCHNVTVPFESFESFNLFRQELYFILIRL